LAGYRSHFRGTASLLAERDTHIAGLQSSLRELERRPRGLFASGAPLPTALSRMTRPVLSRLGSR